MRSVLGNSEAIVMSWIVVSKATGKAVFETFNARTALAVNLERYDVLTAEDYLERFNASLVSLCASCKCDPCDCDMNEQTHDYRVRR
jgi:hypothetical protein